MKKSVILLGLLLGGCEAVIPQTAANMKMSRSQEALRACLLENPGDAAKCETQRQLYDLDMASYRATMGSGYSAPPMIPYYNSPPPGTPAVHGQ